MVQIFGHDKEDLHSKIGEFIFNTIDRIRTTERERETISELEI